METKLKRMNTTVKFSTVKQKGKHKLWRITKTQCGAGNKAGGIMKDEVIATPVETEVKVFQTRLWCECGGELKHNGYSYATSPVSYVHQCKLCNKKVEKTQCYPTIVYREVSLRVDTP